LALFFVNPDRLGTVFPIYSLVSHKLINKIDKISLIVWLMTTKVEKMSFTIAIMAFLLLLQSGDAMAQFSKAVVVYKGKVRNAETLTPHAVNVSVREVNNKALEITASRSNSESGNYLVVLKPQTKYWLHIEGPDVQTDDILIETPAVTGRTVNVEQDITVSVLSPIHTAKK
ncbi:MAG TPA: hypothetical protein VJ508_11905, partial [Saprospiraceae bacterium]|nr:hypothetical protein [Saprospiraceae bacterium]